MRNGAPVLSLSLSAKRNHQWPVFEAQLKLAKQIHRPDRGYYPLVLHLRGKESMNTDVQSDAIKLTTEAGQEMVQFLRELVTSPPKEATAVLDRWYQRITASSTPHFRCVHESDVKLALRKRFHGCFEAHGWLKCAEPPFAYDCQLRRKTYQTELLNFFDAVRNMMPEALSSTFYQFVMKQPQGAKIWPVEDLELVEEEWYDDPDQPGPSQSTDDSRRGPDQTYQPRSSRMRRRHGARD